MWTVDKAVDRYEGKNVNCSYPQFRKILPQLTRFFIHREMGRVLRA
jgi:hypothetical protein